MPPRFAAFQLNTKQSLLYKLLEVPTNQVDAAELDTSAKSHHVLHLVMHVQLEELLTWRPAVQI